MTTEPEGEERINEAIAERQAALDAGQYFDDAAWLHRNATLAPALKEFLEDERRLTARVTAAVPFAGGRFGRYRLGELLGRGSMGIVYRADDERGGPTVALKLLVGCLFSDADAVAMERFAREARLVAGLDHPGIIPLLDSGSLAGIPYLAMPLIDGLDLGEVIRQARSESEESALVLMADAPSRFLVVASVGLQAARALVHAHDQGASTATSSPRTCCSTGTAGSI
jgi:serine/threonine protein kinase